MPGRGHLDAAAPSMWALLTGLGGRHRLKLALTYALTLAENGLNILYPVPEGIAIDALLAGRWVGMTPLLIAWTVHLAAGLFRHVYDTRVFTLVYADLAADLVERQRAQGTNAAQLAARVRCRARLSTFSRSRCQRCRRVRRALRRRCRDAVRPQSLGGRAHPRGFGPDVAIYGLWFSRVRLRSNPAPD